MYKLDLEGHTFVLAGNRVAYEFDRSANQRTDKVQGVRFDVVDLDNSYEHLSVLVEGSPSLLFEPDAEIPKNTEVVFENLVARPYVGSNNRLAVTAKADACRLRLTAQPRGKE